MNNWHFHRWSKWSNPIINFDGHKQQWRVCEICNKAQFFNLRFDGQSDIGHAIAAISSVKGTEQ